jgi:low affinity Fe/Cu permease
MAGHPTAGAGTERAFAGLWNMNNKVSFFTRFSKETSRVAGRPLTFALAVIVLVAWAVTGPMFDYSDTWQLIINTGTTIVTFLMVFLIQATQNRDTEALHLKLDEIIRAIHGAKNSFINLEELDEEELTKLHEEYNRLAEKARQEKVSRS